MNKTQQKIIERLAGMHGTGNLKQGWTFCDGVLSLQNHLDGNQAHKLAEKYPERFETSQVSFRLVKIRIINEAAK